MDLQDRLYNVVLDSMGPDSISQEVNVFCISVCMVSHQSY